MTDFKERASPLRLRDVALLTLWAFWGLAALVACAGQQRWDGELAAKTIVEEQEARPSILELLARPSCATEGKSHDC